LIRVPFGQCFFVGVLYQHVAKFSLVGRPRSSFLPQVFGRRSRRNALEVVAALGIGRKIVEAVVVVS